MPFRRAIDIIMYKFKSKKYLSLNFEWNQIIKRRGDIMTFSVDRDYKVIDPKSFI